MPKNKEALYRYRVINRCLVENKYVTKQYLKDACERALDIPVGERTIDGDIHDMRKDDRLGYFAPIKHDRYRGAYYYEDPEYSIDNIPLNEDEMDSILFASRLLEQFMEVEVLRTFSGTAQKLADAMKVYRNNDEDSLHQYIQFEKTEKAKGNEFIEPLMEALKKHQVLEIEYQAFYSVEKSRPTVHPYLLKEYGNRWYLVAYNEEKKGLRTYALDRVISLRDLPGKKFIDSGFNGKAYYQDVIGITKPEKEPVKIKLYSTKFQAQYLLTKPLHASQEVLSEDDNSIVFGFYLAPNFEFISKIMGWQENVEVLEPVWLREEIKHSIKRMMELYTGGKPKN